MRLIVSLRYSRTCLSIKHWGGSVSTINLLQCQHSKIINDNIKGLFFNLLYTHFDPGVDPSFLGDTYFWKCEDPLPVIQVSICLPNGHFKIFLKHCSLFQFKQNQAFPYILNGQISGLKSSHEPVNICLGLVLLRQK